MIKSAQSLKNNLWAKYQAMWTETEGPGPEDQGGPLSEGRPPSAQHVQEGPGTQPKAGADVQEPAPCTAALRGPSSEGRLFPSIERKHPGTKVKKKKKSTNNIPPNAQRQTTPGEHDEAQGHVGSSGQSLVSPDAQRRGHREQGKGRAALGAPDQSEAAKCSQPRGGCFLGPWAGAALPP